MQSQKQWIVLVNRTQQGPFSESEIQEFLVDGSLKASDLGYLITGTKGFPEWKFLWQFPEFERRSATPDESQRPEPDRRTNPTEGQIQAKIDAQVPPEFRNQAQAVGLVPKKKPPEFQTVENALEEAAKWRRATMGLAAAFVLVLGAAAVSFFVSGSSPTATSPSVSASVAISPPAVIGQPPKAMAMPVERPMDVVVKRAPAQAPAQPSGAVSLAQPAEPVNTSFTTAIPIEIQNIDDEDYE